MSESQTRIGERRDVGFAFLHDVEMRVEGRRLEHFRKGQLHLVGKRRQMFSGNLVIFVLDQMQVLDQEIAPARPVAEQGLDLVRRGRIDLAALGCCLRPPATLAGVLERANLMDVMAHGSVSSARDRRAWPDRALICCFA